MRLWSIQKGWPRSRRCGSRSRPGYPSRGPPRRAQRIDLFSFRKRREIWAEEARRRDGNEKKEKEEKSCTCAAAAGGQTLVKHSRIHAALFPGLFITQQHLLKVKGRRCFPATLRAPSPDRQHNRPRRTDVTMGINDPGESCFIPIKPGSVRKNNAFKMCRYRKTVITLGD